MAIKSSAFGRVTLTDDDARKFNNQVRYGKPKAAATGAVKRGIAMSKEFHSNGGKLKITLKREKA